MGAVWPAPSTASRDQWPPDYVSVFGWRQNQLRKLRGNPQLLAGARAYYATHPEEFINHWVDTYDPRNAGSAGKLTQMPLVMFPRQSDLIAYIQDLVKHQSNGLVEKCRDMGATWVCCGLSVHMWLFLEGAAIGWGSRKESLVDKVGDPDSIFEKLRSIIRRIPDVFMPRGFVWREHSGHMKLVNPESGATITGEAGDNIGRGGRKLVYFKDESAHYERPELIEAALSHNTNVQIDISSVNGPNNVFYRRRQAGEIWKRGGNQDWDRTQILIMDWSDHPAKDQSWYDRRKAKSEAEGLGHIFAQEVDRNYNAALSGTIIKPEWVKAALDFHKRHNIEPSGARIGSMDVADDGPDKHGFVYRHGIVCRMARDYTARDPGAAARDALADAVKYDIDEFIYDCIGVGAAVKSEINRLVEDDGAPAKLKAMRFSPWNAAGAVLDPYDPVIPDDDDSPLNRDLFQNIKAQGWWGLGRRFYRTWQVENGIAEHDPDTLISIDSDGVDIHQLESELCQVTIGRSPSTLKMVVNKTPDGSSSPNQGDSVMMAYWPIPADDTNLWQVGGSR